MKVLGVDFTSAPGPRKAITVARCTLGSKLVLEQIEELRDFDAFEALLREPGPWIGGFDFPFGISRQAVRDIGWPATWLEMVLHCKSLGKAEFKSLLDAYRESRLAPSRYATRRGDKASGAHPSVKLVNPPVGYMFLQGAPRLAEAGLAIPPLVEGDPSRVALEAYPGLLIRKHLGVAAPYKNDARRKQTPDQKARRTEVLQALMRGKPHGTPVHVPSVLQRRVVEDGSGDLLDALVCAVQAAWGFAKGPPTYGLPADVDPLEGWIVTA